MAFREMRKKERQMTNEQILEVIQSENYGVLSVAGDGGYPYGVPINYGWSEGRFYIHHTVAESHLSDALRQDPKVCFTITARHEMDAAILSTHFASVVVFGTARLVTDTEEKVDALRRMMEHLAPDRVEAALEHCKTDTNYLMIEITPEHMTGKCRR